MLIIGGGIMGLWAALKAARRGLSVVLVERDRIGAGASGGLLGALMPHTPDRWNAKKQLQFEALVQLESEIATLEAAHGLSAGYRRCGRIAPFAKPHLRAIAVRQAKDALVNWRQGADTFAWIVQDDIPFAGWPETAAAGLVIETMAARVNPRRLLALLSRALRRCSMVRILEGKHASAIDAQRGRVAFADGTVIEAGSIILAAGVSSFAMVDGLAKRPAPPRPSGAAVKGQAILLDAGVDPALPILFADGLYIVPHENGCVAIGSTSETRFSDPVSTDALLDTLTERAFHLVPTLRQARVVERWAGLRPRAIGREPMIGRHPHYARLFLLTGGYKVSFGIAHRIADAVVADIVNDPPIPLPADFDVAVHLAVAAHVAEPEDTHENGPDIVSGPAPSPGEDGKIAFYIQ